MANSLGLLAPKYAAPADWSQDKVSVAGTAQTFVVRRTGLYLASQANLDDLVTKAIAAEVPLVYLDLPPMGFHQDARLDNPGAYYPTPALLAEMISSVYTVNPSGLAARVAALEAQAWTPEMFDAAGGGADDTEALLNCYAAAQGPVGPRVVRITNLHGFRGTLKHLGFSVIGPGIPRQTVDSSPEVGLIALDSSATYQYGDWAEPNSEGDNPGPLRDLPIDGDYVSDLVMDLRCVDGLIENCHVVHAAPGGKTWENGGAQNCNIRGGNIGWSPDAIGVSFTGVTADQGAGHLNFDGVYFATSGKLFHATAQVGEFWPHDITLQNCLFENYEPGNDLIHIEAGKFTFFHPVITNSNDGSIQPPNDCLVLVEQTPWPNIPTQVTMHDPEFNTALGTDFIRTVSTGVGNFIRIYGQHYWNGADFKVCLDGGGAFSSFVTIDGDAFDIGDINPYRCINGAWGHVILQRSSKPVRYEEPEDPDVFLSPPYAIRQYGNLNDRVQLWPDRILFGAGVDPPDGGSISYDETTERMNLGKLWEVANAHSLRTSAHFISTVGQDVSISAADTAFPAYALAFVLNNATVDLTLTDGISDQTQHLQILLMGTATTGNGVNWPVNVHNAPQPRDNDLVVVDLVRYGTDWYARVRADTTDMATQAELDAHTTDAIDAHDASAISVVPTGTIASTDVQAALAELDTEKIAKALIDAKGDIVVGSANDTPTILGVGANGMMLVADSTQATGLKWVAASAANITNTPAGNIAATNVQAALNELDTEKAALAGAQFTGPLGVTHGGTIVNTVGQAVALNAAAGQPSGMAIDFFADSATANVTLANGFDGQEYQIILWADATKGNKVIWPSNIKNAPQPIDGSTVVVRLIKFGGTNWYASSTDGWSYERLAADFTESLTNATDVFAGFTPAAGVEYEVEIFGEIDTAVSTTAFLGAMLGPASPQMFSFGIDMQSAAGTKTSRVSQAPGTFPPFTDTAAGVTPYFVKGRCRWTTPGAGSVKFQAKSEVAASQVKMYAKSYMRWRALP